MEEELSENEVEERLYATLHHVDQTQKNVNTDQKEINVVDKVYHTTFRRYWHTSNDHNTVYRKINPPKEQSTDKNLLDSSQHKRKNEENNLSSTSDLSIFQQPVPKNIKRTVEILENEELNRIVELESSDEDEVIEVALPPKPTITIESSDEDDARTITTQSTEKKVEKLQDKENRPNSNREVTASPVPSVVSSVSDEFIRGDCIALNISSRHASDQSFDFSLHGSDLLGQTPTRKKKKKRNKDATSTPISTPANSAPISVDVCFATPKSKAKNKRQRTKSYRVTEKSIPNADVYDSDSNQSVSEGNKNQSPYSITDKSLPNTDVYESDSNQSETVKETTSQSDTVVNKEIESSSSSTEIVIDTSITPKRNNDSLNKSTVIDLTDSESRNTMINENILMGNVSGLTEVDSYVDENTLQQDTLKCGSTKIPAILNEDLDFDNLKGNDKVCKKRRYSLTTLRAEMEKFYNESWGGEDFNHREIQKNMSRDKSLWVIDPKDRMSSFSRRKNTCTYCNRIGHREDTCRMKPPVCFMCGSAGHFEPRCPRKICVNCGSPNHMYSTMCRNCSNWNSMRCVECGQNGHPSSHCPDLWRRYHNTTNLHLPLEENRQLKKYYQTFCSGCTRRGHLVHTCRISLPFSGLPINSPYVAVYRPVFSQNLPHGYPQRSDPNDQRSKQCRNRNISQNLEIPSLLPSKNDSLKRQSKSPVNHDTHVNKKKNFGTPDDAQISQRTKSPINNTLQKKIPLNKEPQEPSITNKDTTETSKNEKTVEGGDNQVTDKLPDFIPISSENHDKKGQIIQDNEVSDTSDVVTSARIYVTTEIAEKLKTEEGNVWMKEAVKKNNVTLESDNIIFFLSIKGTVGNQEAFQAELRDWINIKPQNKARPVSENEDITQESNNDQYVMSNDIPKNRNNALRKLTRAFETLKTDLGEPKALYRELVYLQNKHQQLLKQKVINPQQLSNNKNNINGMLKKLNMVLLGQAGLADGSKHLSELHHLQDKLTCFRQKNIPTSMREEIGQHFHCIFTAIPRNDYVELLSKYYNNPASTLKKKNNDKYYKTPILNQKNMVEPIQHLQNNINFEKNARACSIGYNTTAVLKPAIEKTKNKLLFYHTRLLRSKPMDMVHKKTKTELVKKLNSQITSLTQKCYTSKKSFRRMKKVQEQIQLFLSNI